MTTASRIATTQARSTRFKVPDGPRWSPWTEKKLSFSLAASALHLVVRQILPPVPQHHTHVSRKQRGSCSFKLIKRFKTGAYIEPLVRLLTGTSGRIALHRFNLELQKSPSRILGQNRGNSVDISKAFLENVIWKFESSQVSQAVAQLEIVGTRMR